MSLDQWLASVPGFGPDSIRRAKHFFDVYKIEPTLLDYLVSDDGVRLLEQHRSNPCKDDENATEVADPAPEQVAVAKPKCPRQRFSAEDRRSEGHYFSQRQARQPRTRPPASERQQRCRESTTCPQAADAEELVAESSDAGTANLSSGYVLPASPPPSPYLGHHGNCETLAPTSDDQLFGAVSSGGTSSDYIPGILKSFSKDTGYGFIKCGEIEKDIFFRSSQLPLDAQPEVGSAVHVSVVFNTKGQPQAHEVVLLHSIGHPEGQRYCGVLKSVGDKCGFIECMTACEDIGTNQDIYVPLSQLPSGAKPSMRVTFRLSFNARGQPQARETSWIENDSLPSVGKAAEIDERIDGRNNSDRSPPHGLQESRVNSSEGPPCRSRW